MADRVITLRRRAHRRGARERRRGGPRGSSRGEDAVALLLAARARAQAAARPLAPARPGGRDRARDRLGRRGARDVARRASRRCARPRPPSTSASASPTCSRRSKRAPEGLARRIAEIPGVQAVETRIARFAVLDVAGFEEPVIGRLVSIPERGEPMLNRLMLRAGRSSRPERPDEVVVSEAFAEGHALEPGDTLRALINGKQRTLQRGRHRALGGVRLRDGAGLADARRPAASACSGWAARRWPPPTISTAPSTTSRSRCCAAPRRTTVIAALDQLLAPYGGIGAYARNDQPSNWFLMSEIDQLGNMATTLPAIFLAVAAFLTSMVLNRLIAIERSEIGLLKAFGYSNCGGRLALRAARDRDRGDRRRDRHRRSAPGSGAASPRCTPSSTASRSSSSGRARGCTRSRRASRSARRCSARRARWAARCALPPAEAMRPPAPTLYSRAGGIGARSSAPSISRRA